MYVGRVSSGTLTAQDALMLIPVLLICCEEAELSEAMYRDMSSCLFIAEVAAPSQRR